MNKNFIKNKALHLTINLIYYDSNSISFTIKLSEKVNNKIF